MNYIDENQPLTPRSILLVLLLCTLWGGLAVSVKIGLEGIPPILLAAMRFGVALVCVYAWTRLAKVSLHVDRGDRLIIIVPALVMVVQILFLNIGAENTSGSHTVLFMQTYPFFVAAIAHYIIPKDRLSLMKMIGLALAGAGMMLTIYDKQGGPSTSWGDILVLSSAICLATQIMINKVLLRRISPVPLIFWQQVLILPVFIVLWLSTEWQMPVSIDLKILAAVIYQGAVVAGFCFLVWIRLLQRHSATQISAFFFTTPLFGVLLSWLMLGDHVTTHLTGGLILLAAGLWVVNRY